MISEVSLKADLSMTLSPCLRISEVSQVSEEALSSGAGGLRIKIKAYIEGSTFNFLSFFSSMFVPLTDPTVNSLETCVFFIFLNLN